MLLDLLRRSFFSRSFRSSDSGCSPAYSASSSTSFWTRPPLILVVLLPIGDYAFTWDAFAAWIYFRVNSSYLNYSSFVCTWPGPSIAFSAADFKYSLFEPKKLARVFFSLFLRSSSFVMDAWVSRRIVLSVLFMDMEFRAAELIGWLPLGEN